MNLMNRKTRKKYKCRIIDILNIFVKPSSFFKNITYPLKKVN